MSHLEKLLPPKDALPEGESKSAEDNQTVSLFIWTQTDCVSKEPKDEPEEGTLAYPGELSG